MCNLSQNTRLEAKWVLKENFFIYFLLEVPWARTGSAKECCRIAMPVTGKSTCCFKKNVTCEVFWYPGAPCGIQLRHNFTINQLNLSLPVISNCTLEWKPPVWLAPKAANQAIPHRGQPQPSLVFNPLSSLFFLLILISLHSHHPLYLSSLLCFSLYLSLPSLLLSLLGHAYARWPFQWMVYWPPLDTPRRITPCWALMTSST